MKKQILALLLALMLVGGVLAGCAESANDNASANANDNAGEEDVPEAEGDGEEDGTTAPAAGSGMVSIALASLGSTLDPVDTTDATSSAFIYATYDRLVKYAVVEENGQRKADVTAFEPSIAKSWETAEDGLTWTFYLDENAVFANGDPVTAEDVAFTFWRCAERPKGEFVFSLTNIEEINVIDDYTVEFKLNNFCPIFLQLIEMYSFGITNKAEVEGQPDEYLTSNTAGSGPYRITKYDVATEVVLEARDDYWGQRAANDRIVVQLVAEVSNRQLLVEKGDIDLTVELSEKDLAGLDAQEDLVVETNPSNKIMFFAMNQSFEPFDNPLVRRAITHAIPYDSLVNDIMYGQATRMKSMIPTIMPGHVENENTYHEYNLELAQELLKEAGYEDGFEFDFTLGSGFQDWEDASIVIQAELAKIGVTMNIIKMERSQFLELAGQNKLECFINRFVSFVNDPGYLTGLLLHTDGDFNYYSYSNSELDSLYDASNYMTDDAERMAAFAQMQELVAADAPWAYLYEYDNHVVYRSDLEGYVYYPDLTVRYETLTKR